MRELNRSALGRQVADRLREGILRGEYLPGDSLPEPQLAELFEVSRGPVREALAALEREGLVLSRPHRTAEVAQLTHEDIEELYSLRLALELLAVRSATRNATDADFQLLEEAVDELRAIGANPSSEHSIARADLGFHDALYSAAHHRRLRQCWLDVRSQIYLFLLMRNLTVRQGSGKAWRDRLIADHCRIIELLRDRDAQAAAEFVEEHLREPYIGLLGIPERDGTAPRRGTARSNDQKRAQRA